MCPYFPPIGVVPVHSYIQGIIYTVYIFGHKQITQSFLYSDTIQVNFFILSEFLSDPGLLHNALALQPQKKKGVNIPARLIIPVKQTHTQIQFQKAIATQQWKKKISLCWQYKDYS